MLTNDSVWALAGAAGVSGVWGAAAERGGDRPQPAMASEKANAIMRSRHTLEFLNVEQVFRRPDSGPDVWLLYVDGPCRFQPAYHSRGGVASVVRSQRRAGGAERQ